MAEDAGAEAPKDPAVADAPRKPISVMPKPCGCKIIKYSDIESEIDPCLIDAFRGAARAANEQALMLQAAATRLEEARDAAIQRQINAQIAAQKAALQR